MASRSPISSAQRAELSLVWTAPGSYPDLQEIYGPLKEILQRAKRDFLCMTYPEIWEEEGKALPSKQHTNKLERETCIIKRLVTKRGLDSLYRLVDEWNHHLAATAEQFWNSEERESLRKFFEEDMDIPPSVYREMTHSIALKAEKINLSQRITLISEEE